jgi:hypothetical protein
MAPSVENELVANMDFDMCFIMIRLAGKARVDAKEH